VTLKGSRETERTARTSIRVDPVRAPNDGSRNLRPAKARVRRAGRAARGKLGDVRPVVILGPGGAGTSAFVATLAELRVQFG
jgi:hypothetical protein